AGLLDDVQQAGGRPDPMRTAARQGAAKNATLVIVLQVQLGLKRMTNHAWRRMRVRCRRMSRFPRRRPPPTRL
ncbi:hypothetical protein, partial [Nonomuraea sp. NPDC049625]|uniref:hypothetical protein n=1 Tax=Nonomuraea sp. NPDC049625 TaxID=3155775 RepID=UPI0034161268